MKRFAFPVAAGLAALGVLWTIYEIFYGTPLAKELFFNQKIFYWHVPHAFMLFVSVFICGIASIVYLAKDRRDPRYDDLARATGDVAALYGAIVLVTGSVWGRAAWGVWWQWDMRLTLSLLLWLLMVGYALVRRFAGSAADGLAAGLAIFAMVNVPLVYLSVKIWRTVHPKAEVVQTLDPAMRGAFWVSVATFALLFGMFVVVRAMLARDERRIVEARERAIDAGLLDD